MNQKTKTKVKINMNTYELEQSILSIILLDNNKIKELILEEKHFGDETNRKVFKMLLDVYEKYSVIDTKTLSHIVKSKDELFKYLNELWSVEYTTANFFHYQELLIEKYKDKKIKEEVLKYSKEELTKEEFVLSVNKIDNEYSKNNVYQEFSNEDIYNLITTDKEILKFMVFSNMQSKIKFMKNTFNVISARPSVGKSAFALNLFSDLLNNYRCLYFNMEMNEKEIYQRIISINTKVPIKDFVKMSANQSNIVKAYLSSLKAKSEDFKIINGSQNIKNLKQTIIKEQRKGHTIVFVDYIGYVFTKESHNDRERIGEVARELQMLTKDCDITVFCLSQINREGAKTPSMENLKDSGELEQSAHSVLILHDEKDDVNDLNPEIDLIISKNRSGRKGKIKLEFEKEKQIFKEK